LRAGSARGEEDVRQLRIEMSKESNGVSEKKWQKLGTMGGDGSRCSVAGHPQQWRTSEMAGGLTRHARCRCRNAEHGYLNLIFVILRACEDRERAAFLWGHVKGDLVLVHVADSIESEFGIHESRQVTGPAIRGYHVRSDNRRLSSGMSRNRRSTHHDIPVAIDRCSFVSVFGVYVTRLCVQGALWDRQPRTNV
jgi:hypothetical protein